MVHTSETDLTLSKAVVTQTETQIGKTHAAEDRELTRTHARQYTKTHSTSDTHAHLFLSVFLATIQSIPNTTQSQLSTRNA